MRFRYLLLAGVTLLSTSSCIQDKQNKFQVVGYVPNWEAEEGVPLLSKETGKKLTEACTAFFTPNLPRNPDEKITFVVPDKALAAIKKMAPQAMLCLSFGGYSNKAQEKVADIFYKLTATNESIINLAKSILTTTKAYGGKVVDIDYEMHTMTKENLSDEGWKRLIEFIKVLAPLVKAERIKLTIALPSPINEDMGKLYGEIFNASGRYAIINMMHYDQQDVVTQDDKKVMVPDTFAPYGKFSTILQQLKANGVPLSNTVLLNPLYCGDSAWDTRPLTEREQNGGKLKEWQCDSIEQSLKKVRWAQKNRLRGVGYWATNMSGSEKYIPKLQ